MTLIAATMDRQKRNSFFISLKIWFTFFYKDAAKICKVFEMGVAEMQNSVAKLQKLIV